MKKTSGLAVASMVLGIVAVVIAFIPIINLLVFIIGVLAIVFGIVALAKKTGTGHAVAGVVTGAIGVVVSVSILAAITIGVSNITKVSNEKRNVAHQVTYKVTSEKPVKVQYGSSKESKEEKVIGVWEKSKEIVGVDSVILTTFPEDLAGFNGKTTCEITVDGIRESTDGGSLGYASCGTSIDEIPEAARSALSFSR